MKPKAELLSLQHLRCFCAALALGSFTAAAGPPLYGTFAIVTRAGSRLSPGVREILPDLEAHMRSVAAALDRAR